MDDECRGVRQRRKQADPTCCPVCGVTVRAHEIQQHFSMEMDRLNKLSAQKYRKSQSKEMPSTTTMMNSASSPVASASSTTIDAADLKDCWNTYQRIKNNRSARLKVNTMNFRAFHSVNHHFKSFFFQFSSQKIESDEQMIQHVRFATNESQMISICMWNCVCDDMNGIMAPQVQQMMMTTTMMMI